MNDAGVALLTKSEGIRLTAYLCPAGVPTIGRGHTDGITADMVRDGYTITPAQERELFRQDMDKWEHDVLECLTRKPNENQLAAFICFAYNIGIGGFRGSTVVREFEAGNDRAAATAFGMWNKATVNGHKIVLNGLVTRRAAESALYLTPVTPDPMPQAVDQPGGFKMPAFLLSLLPALLQAAPAISALVGTKPEKSAKQMAALEAVAGIAKTALGAVNEQEVVERLETDPAAPALVKAALEKEWFTLTSMAEIGPGIEGAQKADLAVMDRKTPLWFSPSFVIGVLLLPMAYAVAGTVAGLWGEQFTGEVRAALAASIVSLILGGIVGYYYGTTTSANKAK